MFDEKCKRQLVIARFNPTTDACIYHNSDPNDHDVKCTINLHVGDGGVFSSVHRGNTYVFPSDATVSPGISILRWLASRK